MSEIPKQTTETAAQKNAEMLREHIPLSDAVSALQNTLGRDRHLEEPASSGTIDRELSLDQQRVVYTDMEDLSYHNAMRWRKKSMQLQKFIKDSLGYEPGEARRELITANQAITYNEYFPAVLRQLTEFTARYDDEMEAMFPSLPPARREQLLAERAQALRYIEAVRAIVLDRLHFTNVRGLDEALYKSPNDPAIAKMLADEFALLSQRSREAIQRERDMNAERLQADKNPKRQSELLTDIFRNRNTHILDLENDLIEMLKGNPEGKDLPGAPKDFLPQRLYLRLLQERYAQLRGLQVEIAGKKEWSEGERRAAQDTIRLERRQRMSQMVGVTQLLAAHHVGMAELSAIQHQFGDEYILDGVSRPLKATTDEKVRDKVDTSIDGTRVFHLERLQGMLTEVDRAFNPRGMKNLTDAGVMELVKKVDGLSGMLRGLISAGMPEGEMKKTMGQWMDTHLPLAITEALESDVGPDGRPLSKAKKMESIVKVIKRFRDAQSVQRYRETVTVLQAMPPPKEFVMDDVQGQVITSFSGKRFDKSPAGTSVTIDGVPVSINGATATVLMLRQMKSDGEAFAGDYGTFLREMEDLVDIRLSLIAEVNRIADSWKILAESIGIGAGAALVLPWIVAGSGGTVALWTLRKTPAALRLLAKSPREVAKLLAPEKVLGTAALAVQAYRIYEDFQEIGEVRKGLDAERARMIAQIRSAGFEPDPATQEDRFTYRDGGTEVTVNVRDLSDAREGQMTSQMVQTGGDVAQLFLILRALRAGTAPLRAAPPVIAVEVAIETIRYGVDQKSDRTFIGRCPAWLLAKIDVENTIGDSPYGMLATASEPMLTDIITKESTKNKEDIRQKMLFVLLQQELSEVADVQLELFPRGTHPRELDIFFQGDFQKVLLPYYALRLHQLSDGALTLPDAQKNRVGNDVNNLPARTPEVSLLNVRRALREAALVCTEHKREREYVSVQKALASVRSDPERDDLTIGILQTAVQELGKRRVLGSTLESIPKEALPSQDDPTRVERLVALLTTQVQRGNWKIPAQSIPGVGSALDYSSGKAVMNRMVTDPALRMQIEALYPRTLAERDNAAGKEWHDVAFYASLPRLQSPSTIGRSVNEDLSFASGAADNIRGELSRKKITAPPTVSGVLLGASSGNQATTEHAYDRITKDGIDLVESDPNIATQRAHLQEDGALAGQLYPRSGNQPLVFTTGSPDLQICRTLGNGNVPKEYRGSLPLQAVIFEPKTFEKRTSGMVLATYIFGDPLQGEIFVTQRASAQSSLARSQGPRATDGFPRSFTSQELQNKPGFSQMLNAVRTKMRLRAMQERLQEIQEEKQRPERIRKEEEARTEYRNKREEAMQQSQESESYVLVPGKSSGDPSEYWRRFGDQILSITVPYRGASLGEGKKLLSGVVQPNGDDAIFVRIRDKNGNEIRTVTLPNAASMESKELTPDDRSAVRAALTTPVFGQDRESLMRVIRLFPREVYLPGSIASLRYKQRFFMPELLDVLLPLYTETENAKKAEFLAALFDRLSKQGVINEKTNTQIITWFKANASQFAAKK
jgi:hypothetical protein